MVVARGHCDATKTKENVTDIHPSAVVHAGAKIGRDVTIGPYCTIEEDVRIGDGCRLGPRVSVMRYTTLGDGCVVHANAVLGDLPQDLSFAGAVSFVQIGEQCTIREGVTVQRGTAADSTTVVGDNCYLMAYAHCAHNVKLGTRVILVNNVMLAGYVDIGDGTFVGGGAGIHQFCRVGRLAMIGGNSSLSVDVPPFMTTHSGGYNDVAALNVVGMRRAGMGGDERKAVKQAFSVLYGLGLNRQEAVQRIRQRLPSGPAQEIAEFVASTKRGICRPKRMEVSSVSAPSEDPER